MTAFQEHIATCGECSFWPVDMCAEGQRLRSACPHGNDGDCRKCDREMDEDAKAYENDLMRSIP